MKPIDRDLTKRVTSRAVGNRYMPLLRSLRFFLEVGLSINMALLAELGRCQSSSRCHGCVIFDIEAD